MDNIAKILNDYLKSGKSSSLNFDIANYMLKHVDGLADMRLSDVASSCHVSSPSVIRFCREIGFDDYKDFRNSIKLQNEINSGKSLGVQSYEFDVVNSDLYSENIANWADEIAAHIKESLSDIDNSLIVRLSEDIIKYNTVVFYANGLSTLFGDYLNFVLGLQRKPIISVSRIDEWASVVDKKEDTLVVIVSQYGRLLKEINEFMPYLKKNTDKIWLVTHLPIDEKIHKDIDESIHIKKTQYHQINSHSFLGVAELLGQYCNKIYEEKDI